MLAPDVMISIDRGATERVERAEEEEEREEGQITDSSFPPYVLWLVSWWCLVYCT